MSGHTTVASRARVEPPPAVGRTQRAELIAAADNLLARIEYRDRQTLTAPIFAHRHGFDVATAQRGPTVEQASLDDRAVRDDRAVMPDQRVHPA